MNIVYISTCVHCVHMCKYLSHTHITHTKLSGSQLDVQSYTIIQ